MRMGSIFSGVFWGIILLLIGGSVLLRATTGLKIPVFRIAVGLILIYWGGRVLFGVFGSCKGKNGAIFSEASIKTNTPGKKYTTLFGSSMVDLSGIQLKDENVKVNSYTVFGSTIMIIPKGIPVIVKANVVFASAKFPDDSSAGFGDKVYRSDNFYNEKPALVIDADVVFGELVIREE